MDMEDHSGLQDHLDLDGDGHAILICQKRFWRLHSSLHQSIAQQMSSIMMMALQS